MGVVVQALIEPVAAGVLFTRNPMTGADERLIEAAWGLGEAVVNGAVVPDRVRLDPDGRVVDVTVGEKDIKVVVRRRGRHDGGARRRRHCSAACASSRRTSRRCTNSRHAASASGDRDLDLEWALDAGGRIFLLQCRPITTGRT